VDFSQPEGTQNDEKLACVDLQRDIIEHQCGAETFADPV
jgi:hypothetical protein